jgi:methionine synthase I (cobalamin-dependent)
MGALPTARDHIAEQIRLLKDAGVDFLILETFFHLAEMKVALEAAAESGLATVATMSFRPLVTLCSDGHTPAECARVIADLGAVAVGANCEQDPGRMLALLREMRDAGDMAIAAQPSAFRTTDECHSFTRLSEFPDALETIQIPRREFAEFGRFARSEGIRYVGGCCGCNAAYIRSLAVGVATTA